jgi:hypothetical protein
MAIGREKIVRNSLLQPAAKRTPLAHLRFAAMSYIWYFDPCLNRISHTLTEPRHRGNIEAAAQILALDKFCSLRNKDKEQVLDDL